MKFYNLLAGLVIIFISIGCSSGSNHSTPTIPENLQDGLISSAPDYMVNTRGVFGAWEVIVDTQTLSAEILPSRNASAIGDIFDADLSQFLEISPCANCVSLGNIFVDTYGNINIEMYMRHPFPNPTARPDLNGFDIRGIYILPSDLTDANIDVLLPGDVTEDASWSMRMLNPDGYTSHFDELASDERYFVAGTSVVGNLNPFLRFFEDYTTPVFDPALPHGWNVMPVGSMNYARTAIFSPDNNSLFRFYFVADMAYGQSAVLANRMAPQYYLPAFNRTEPWRVEYWLENNTLDNHDDLSTADVIVQVFDWQQGATVDAGYPDPANLSGIPAQSNVLRVELSAPGLQDDPLVQTSPVLGTGSPTDPLQYEFTVTNTNQWDWTPAVALLAIRDDLYGQAYPSGRMAVPESPAGFPYATLDILDYSLYMPIYLNFERADSIYEDTHEIFGDHEVYIPFEDQVALEHSISGYRTTLHPRFFMDPGGNKFQYRWDYDYDGLTFDIDGSGNPSPEIEFTTPGRHDVGLRIRTNSVPPQEYIYTIPVYADGITLAQTMPATIPLGSSTSEGLRHSMYQTTDNTYLVYTYESAGQRDIWLAIIDNYGNVTQHQVTDEANPNSQPSITGDYSNEHIYIAYSTYESPNTYVYVTTGNSDGTGFGPANQKRVSTSVNVAELMPVLHKRGSLSVFYFHWHVLTGRIYASHSDDWGETWNEDGWVLDNGSTGQIYPTVANGGWGRMLIVWQDNLNMLDNGWDLYLAESEDGITFSHMKNISIFRDNVDEMMPSSDFTRGLAYISYIAQAEGSDKQTVRFKAVNLSPYPESHTDYELQNGVSGTRNHTKPTIDTHSDGHTVIAFGSWDRITEDLSAYVVDLYQEEETGEFDERLLINTPIGNVGDTFLENEINPAICMRSMADRGVFRVTYAYRDYSTGSFESPVTPIQYFGEIAYGQIFIEND